MEELCGPCNVEVFVKGGKFLEGPAFDFERGAAGAARR
jgi:hypothetical protein